MKHFLRSILHAVFGCRNVTVGYSIMGAPVQVCVDCFQHTVLRGWTCAIECFITEEQMYEIGFEPLVFELSVEAEMEEA